jgi:hypothetical protein
MEQLFVKLPEKKVNKNSNGDKISEEQKLIVQKLKEQKDFIHKTNRETQNCNETIKTISNYAKRELLIQDLILILITRLYNLTLSLKKYHGEFPLKKALFSDEVKYYPDKLRHLETIHLNLYKYICDEAVAQKPDQDDIFSQITFLHECIIYISKGLNNKENRPEINSMEGNNDMHTSLIKQLESFSLLINNSKNYLMLTKRDNDTQQQYSNTFAIR